MAEPLRVTTSSFSSSQGDLLPGVEYDNYGKSRKGCWVSRTKAIVFVLLAIALAVIVGIIVHYASKKDAVNRDDTNTTDAPPEPTKAPLTGLRLPEDIVPYHYNVRLRPYIYGTNQSAFGTEGDVQAYLRCKTATSRIVLHAKDLEIDVASVTVQREADGVNLHVTGTETDDERQFFIVKVSASLEPNQVYIVAMTFKGRIPDSLAGLYYSTYEENGEERVILTSQLQPTDARAVFPCMDEPALKASFNVTMERKKSATSMYSMGNMNIYRTADVDSEWVADYFEPTPIMSTYLLAFIVSDFKCRNTTNVDGKRVSICGRPNAYDQTLFASQVAAPIQDYYQSFHNVTYPLSKTVHVGVPDFSAGAMENWGLIIYRDFNILYSPTESTAAHKQRIVVVIAHELAHMWFGNLVSMDWWGDIWLNEGFASYMETLGTGHQFPEWNMEDDTIASKVQDVMVLDSLVTSHPVFQPASTPDEIQGLFDAIIYDKGASVIRMMHYFLGDKTFVDGISNYLKDRAYNTANHTGLFHFLSQQALNDGVEVDVDAVMKTWILQMGYPVVTFNYDKTQNKVMLSQKHFLLDPTTKDEDIPASPYDYIWKVPITYATSENTDWDNPPMSWLHDKEGSISNVASQARWIIGNTKERFYYRVNYDSDNWNAIIEQLNSDHTKIDRKSRAQLIDDSFNLGRAEVVDQILFLNISRYLKSEQDYLPWRSTFYALGDMDTYLAVTGDYGNYRSFVQNISKPIYERLGWNTDGSTDIQKQQRALIISRACHYGLPDCESTAGTKFTSWRDALSRGQANPLSADLRYAVYCTALKIGGQDDWDFTFSQQRAATAESEKRVLLQALACPMTDWLLRRYLEMALAEEQIRRQDFYTVYLSVARSPVGRRIAWEFLVDNWATIYDRFHASMSFGRLITRVLEGFSTEYYLNLANTFLESLTDPEPTTVRAFEQGMEKIRSNIRWRQQYQDSVNRWLQQEITGTS